MNPVVTLHQEDARAGTKGFVPVPLAILKTVGAAQCDLYIADERTDTHVLFRGSEYEVHAEDFLRLEEVGVRSLYLRSNDLTKFQQQVKQNLQTYLQQQELPATERFEVLQWSVAGEIDQAFQLVHVDGAVDQSKRVGQLILSLIHDSQVIPADLFGVMQHDFYTFTHLINVSSYCLLLAEGLGIHDRRELEAITVGGLLHDVGKRLIPKSVLCKPGRLNEEEWELIRAHPQKGYEELCEREDLNFGQLMMVYQHHEKMDGGGYPTGVTGPEIHHLARMCDVVDVFDAMTCRRSYRRAMPVADVLEHLESIAGVHLDKEMVRCWTSIMRKI